MELLSTLPGAEEDKAIPGFATVLSSSEKLSDFVLFFGFLGF